MYREVKQEASSLATSSKGLLLSASLVQTSRNTQTLDESTVINQEGSVILKFGL